MEYQQIAAGWFVLCSEYGRPPFVGGVVERGAVRVWLVFVFGTLLGPEATGPGCGGWPVWVACRVRGLVFLVSWLHGPCA